MIRLQSLILLILLISQTALAQEWTGERRRGGFRRGTEFFEAISERERSELSQFMKEVSPRRWEIFENLPENSPLRERTWALFVSRYRMLGRVKSDDSALHGVLVERIKVEDIIFDNMAVIKRAVAEDRAKGEIELLQQQLRAHVARLVDLGIKERRIRIDSIEKTLQLERQKLVEDERNREGIITRQLKHLETGGDETSAEAAGVAAESASPQINPVEINAEKRDPVP